MRSFLPGIPLLALTASVQVNERSKLIKACGMIQPVIVDVLPNKENITFNFMAVLKEKEAVSHLRWIAEMVIKNGKDTPQTIVFCNTFNDSLPFFPPPPPPFPSRARLIFALLV